MSLTLAADDYLRRGHHLLALTGKRPNPRYHGKTDDDDIGWSWDQSIHGATETPDDFAALTEVFEHPSTTGIAILIPEGILVADIDTEEAAALYMEVAGEMPDTVVAKTTKGLHVWFIAPGAAGTVWMGGKSGVLFKGFGGYVAAPPSAHFTDHTLAEQDGVYTWITDFDHGMDFLPEPVAERLKFEHALAAVRPAKTAESGGYAIVRFPAPGHFTIHAGYHLDGLCKAIREAADGNQNNMIAWAAMQARDEGVPFDIAMPQLLDAAVQGGHPARRARVTIRGAYSRRPRG